MESLFSYLDFKSNKCANFTAMPLMKPHVTSYRQFGSIAPRLSVGVLLAEKWLNKVSVSVQDGIIVLGKANTRSSPSLSSLPKAALKIVPIFAWLNTNRSRPWKVDCRPLPFSTPLSFTFPLSALSFVSAVCKTRSSTNPREH